MVGGTLLTMIKQPQILKQLSEMKISRMVKTLLESVKLMQRVKIMHRDIKPENIMFRESNDDWENMALIDFGLAEFFDKDKYLFNRCGTPGFVAPEIANSKDPVLVYDGKCDIFSLGCIAHILYVSSLLNIYIRFVGKPLFHGKSYDEVL